MASEYPSDLFIDRNSDLEVRGLTTLLRLIEGSRPSKKEIGTTTTDKEKGAYAKLFNYVQNTFVNSIIRNHKVVAVMVSGKTSTADGGITLVEDAKVTMTLNPPHRLQGDKSGSAEGHVEVVIHKDLPEIPEANLTDIVGFVIEKTAAAIDNGLLEFPFEDHIGYYHGLLKRYVTHSQGDNEEKRQEAADDLRTYVYSVSINKMLRRCKLGCRTKDKPLPEGKKTQNLQASNNPIQHKKKTGRNYYAIVTQDPYDIPGQSLHDPIPRSLIGVYPNESQAKFLQDCLEAIKLEERASLVQASELYDQQGRITFQYVLSCLVEAAYSSLEAASTVMRTEDNKRRRVSRAKFISQAGAIKPRISDVVSSIISLREFLDLFPDVLKQHLKWLHQSCGADREADPQWPSSNKAESPAAGPATLPGGVEPDDEGSQPDDEGFQLDDEGSQPDDGGSQPDDEDYQLEELSLSQLTLTDGPSQSWAEAVDKWLRLICLHESSLILTEARCSQRRPYRNYEADLILSAPLSVIQIHQAIADRRTIDVKSCVKSCFENLAQHEKPENFDSRLVEEELGRNNNLWTSKESFTGAFHAEIILLGLLACLRDSDIKEHMTEKFFEDAGIFASPTDLQTLLANPLPLIHVSKRCCPTCDLVCKVLVERNAFGLSALQENLITPGAHSKTSATKLPPFLPRKIAEECLERIRKKATQNLKSLHDRLRAKKEKAEKSSSSSSQPISDPDSVDNPPSAERSPSKKHQRFQAVRRIDDARAKAVKARVSPSQKPNLNISTVATGRTLESNEESSDGPSSPLKRKSTFHGDEEEGSSMPGGKRRKETEDKEDSD